MLFDTLFLAAIYLVPLILISALGAWVDGRRPYLAACLAMVSAGATVYVWALRPEGPLGLRDVPELSVALVARIMALL